MNEAADTGSHFLTLAILVFYWALLSLWPQILYGDGEDTVGQKVEPSAGRTAPVQPIPALASMVEALRKVDRHFDETAFMLKASQAYETILLAYADGDLHALTSLVGPEVLDVFERAIAERRQSQETLGLTFVGMREISVASTELVEDMAEINVRFIADLVTVTRSAGAVIVAGNSQQIVEVRDLWTFAWNIASAEPDWRVIATDTAC